VHRIKIKIKIKIRIRIRIERGYRYILQKGARDANPARTIDFIVHFWGARVQTACKGSAKQLIVDSDS
jgi:hypothetical protein